MNNETVNKNASQITIVNNADLSITIDANGAFVVEKKKECKATTNEIITSALANGPRDCKVRVGKVIDMILDVQSRLITDWLKVNITGDVKDGCYAGFPHLYYRGAPAKLCDVLEYLKGESDEKRVFALEGICAELSDVFAGYWK